MKDKVITRIAPSPTGPMHIGTARTALFNFLYARGNNGKFITRIEDTDKERSKSEYEEEIFKSLDWLGVSPDEIAKQSERYDIYKKYLEKIIENGGAYLSKEESKNEPGREVEVVRLKNPGKVVEFEDIIRGEVSFDTSELGDLVIAKSINEPLYHFAVVVDDYEMDVTHVIRGEDHISNTPRQILIQEALGFERPYYAHLPMILAEDKSKLSKRKEQVGMFEYIAQGYLPEAIINFLALLGWNPGDDREFFTKEDLIEEFSLKNIQKSGAVFNKDKLKWFNKEYLKKMPNKDFLEGVKKYIPEAVKEYEGYSEEKLTKLIPLLKERISVFYEMTDLFKEGEGEMEFFFLSPEYDVQRINWKDTDIEQTKEYLKTAIEMLSEIPQHDFNYSSIKTKIWNYAEKEGRGQVLWPVRYALSGRDKSPDPFQIAEVLGKKEVLERLRKAVEKINE